MQRVVFYEITKNAVQEAMAQPRELSVDLVNAQQARRALDYLVGFNLSPLLWKKVRPGLSAGRVQSPALRMICEREDEIAAFVRARILDHRRRAASMPGRSSPASWSSTRGAKVEQFSFTSEAQAREVERTLTRCGAGELTRARASTASSAAATRRRRSRPRRCSRRPRASSGFSAQKTMRVAQQLYEGVDIGEGAVGLITYMRTDSLNLAQEAVGQIREVIVQLYGREGLAEEPRVYRTKSKNAQEAHEAIRPTAASILPGGHRKEDRGRPVPPVLADLEAHGRLPDGARGVRHRGGRAAGAAARRTADAHGAARQRLDAGQARLHLGLSGRHGRRGAGRLGPRAAADAARATASSSSA